MATRMRSILLSTLVLLIALTSACRKKPQPAPPQIDPGYGSVRLAFRHVAGNKNLLTDGTKYTTPVGDTFTVSAFKYFISNVALLDASGTEMRPVPTYDLIDQNGSRVATTDGFFPGSYTKVRFLVGVDSARNTSGAQTGDLDPAGVAGGMFWDWQSGYIMSLVEGYSPQSTVSNNRIIFHQGGFTGRNNVLRTVTLDLPSTAVIRDGRTTEIHITTDLAAFFGDPYPISFAQTAFGMGGVVSANIADNYAANGFRVTEVHNE